MVDAEALGLFLIATLIVAAFAFGYCIGRRRGYSEGRGLLVPLGLPTEAASEFCHQCNRLTVFEPAKKG